MTDISCPNFRSIIHTDLKPENVLMDLPPRPPPDSEQPPPLRSRLPKGGFAVRGVAASIDELRATLALADKHGLSAEEKRKLKKKVRGWFREWQGVYIRLCGLWYRSALIFFYRA